MPCGKTQSPLRIRLRDKRRCSPAGAFPSLLFLALFPNPLKINEKFKDINFDSHLFA
jgi:hypothetical protein